MVTDPYGRLRLINKPIIFSLSPIEANNILEPKLTDVLWRLCVDHTYYSPAKAHCESRAHKLFPKTTAVCFGE